jgi:hypothetical protein
VTQSRPAAVSIIAGFLFVASVIAAVVGTAVLFPTPLLDRMWEWNRPGAAVFRTIGPIAGVFLWGLSVAVFAAARSMLRRRRWAWWFAVVLFAVDGLGDVISYPFTNESARTIFGAAVSSVFLILLLRARSYFSL